MWLQRQVNRIGAHAPLMLVATDDPGSGTHFIIAELLDGDAPVLWLDFSDWQESGLAAALDRLARESWGLPQPAVTSLDQACTRLGGFCTEGTVPLLALTGAHCAPELAEQLLELAGPQLRVIICGAAALLDQLANRHPDALQIGEADLRITLAEARDEAFGSISDDDLAAIVHDANGAYETVLRAISRARHADPPVTPSPGSRGQRAVALSLERLSLFDALLRFGLWQPALLECVRHCPERLHEVIDEAGEQCLERGHLRRFWRILMALPAEFQNDERVLYWLTTTSAAQAHGSKLLGRIANHLNHNEAPNLRILAAALDLLPEPLQQARQAHRAGTNKINSLFLAQLEAIHADPAAAVTRLHELRRYFNGTGRHFRQLQSAVALANSYLVAGSYENARYWAGKALEKCAQRELPLPAVQFHATALFAKASLLEGNPGAGQQALAAQPFAQELAGTPLVRAYLRATADYHLLEGNTADAWQAGQLLQRTNGVFSRGRAAGSLVRILIRAGRHDDALELARDVHLRSGGDNAVEGHFAQLAFGLALAASGDVPAACAALLPVVAFSSDRETLHAPLLAQSGISLAQAQLGLGDRQAASATLERARPGLHGLAASGWTLYGGNGSALQQVRDLWEEIREPLHLTFLGYGEQPSGNRRVNLRGREILLLLVTHPQGLTGDRLAGLLDLDRDRHTGMRTGLSRLKKHYPVRSRPYRLAVTTNSDYQLLVDLIAQGRVREAVALYSGPLLPESEVSFIGDLRLELEESLRQAVLHEGDGEVLFALAGKLGTDLQLWEQAVSRLPAGHQSRAVAAARLANLKMKFHD